MKKTIFPLDARVQSSRDGFPCSRAGRPSANRFIGLMTYFFWTPVCIKKAGNASDQKRNFPAKSTIRQTAQIQLTSHLSGRHQNTVCLTATMFLILLSARKKIPPCKTIHLLFYCPCLRVRAQRIIIPTRMPPFYLHIFLSISLNYCQHITGASALSRDPVLKLLPDNLRCSFLSFTARFVRFLSSASMSSAAPLREDQINPLTFCQKHCMLLRYPLSHYHTFLLPARSLRRSIPPEPAMAQDLPRLARENKHR